MDPTQSPVLGSMQPFDKYIDEGSLVYSDIEHAKRLAIPAAIFTRDDTTFNTLTVVSPVLTTHNPASGQVATTGLFTTVVYMNEDNKYDYKLPSHKLLLVQADPLASALTASGHNNSRYDTGLTFDS